MVQRIQDEGLAVPVTVFNTVLNMYATKGDTSMTEMVMRMMSSSNVKPSIITMNVLLKMFCAQGDMDRALEVGECGW